MAEEGKEEEEEEDEELHDDEIEGMASSTTPGQVLCCGKVKKRGQVHQAYRQSPPPRPLGLRGLAARWHTVSEAQRDQDKQQGRTMILHPM